MAEEAKKKKKNGSEAVRKLLVMFSIALAVLFIVLGSYYLPESVSKKFFLRRAFRNFEATAISWRFKARAIASGTTKISKTVRSLGKKPGIYRKLLIATIDDDTINKLGQFPIDRKNYADFLNNINQRPVNKMPSLVFFDIFFDQYSGNEESDRVLFESFANYKAPLGEDFTLEIDRKGYLLSEGTSYELYLDQLKKTTRYYGEPKIQSMKRFEIQAPKGFSKLPYPKINAVLTNLTSVLDFHGAANIEPADESGDIYRKVPMLLGVWYHLTNSDGTLSLTNIYYPSIVLTMVAQYFHVDIHKVRFEKRRVVLPGAIVNGKKQDFSFPVDDKYRLAINYKADPNVGYIRTMSFYRLLRAKLPSNSVVFVGMYALGTAHDIWHSPLGDMFGVEHLAYAFGTIVNRDFLIEARPWVNILYTILFTLLIALIISRGIRWTVLGSALSLLVPMIVGFLLFNMNVMIFLMPTLISALLTLIGGVIFLLMTEEKDKRFLKATFSQYISPDLIDIMYEEKTMPSLGGENRVLTAYFTDIQGFSTFSEKLTPVQLVDLLNEYLTAMTDILLSEEGTLDKYEGDAIISFFGAPMHFEDHAYKALKASVRMQNSLLGLREKWAAEEGDPARNTKGYPPDVWEVGKKWPRIVNEMKMRIGINTGEIVTGNMGSTMRMNYTMMGDSVNLAARLEAGAKQYGVYTMASHFTMNNEFTDEEGVKHKVKDFFEYRFIDNITVVGKSEPVKVYEVVALKGNLTEQEKRLFELFNEGMQHYLAMEWDLASAKFKEALPLERVPDGKTTPSEVFLKRCQYFKTNPPVAPGEKWDGVYRLTSK